MVNRAIPIHHVIFKGLTMRHLCLIFAIAFLFGHTTSKADLVSVSLDFEYGFDSGIFSTVSGNVQFTVDNSESMAGIAVDSITFTDPPSHFQTDNVFVDFREGDDTDIASNNYEFDIYYSSAPVFVSQPGDFAIYAGLLSLEPGDNYGNGPISTSFFYFDGSGYVQTFDDTVNISVSQAIPEPTLAGILGLGMLGVCLTRRRRVTTLAEN